MVDFASQQNKTKQNTADSGGIRVKILGAFGQCFVLFCFGEKLSDRFPIWPAIWPTIWLAIWLALPIFCDTQGDFCRRRIFFYV